MKSLAIAIAIALTICASLFGIFHLFGAGTQVAGPLSSSALGLITFIHDKVDKAFSSGKSRVTPGIVPMAKFTIRWPYMLVYATLSLTAIFELATMVYGLFALLAATQFPTAARDSTEEAFTVLISVMSIPMLGFCIFILGRWIGVRGGKAGYWILPVAMVVSRAVELTCLYLYTSVGKPLFADITSNAISMISAGTLLVTLTVIGLAGVWRGNKVRFGAYFNSLLKQVPQTTRETLLAMTFDEASSAHLSANLPASLKVVGQ